MGFFNILSVIGKIPRMFIFLTSFVAEKMNMGKEKRGIRQQAHLISGNPETEANIKTKISRGGLRRCSSFSA